MRTAPDRVPEFDPRNLDDLMLGCAQPAGEQAHGPGRVVAVLLDLDLDRVPGVTVQR